MKPRVWVCLLIVLTAQPLLFAESLNTDGAQQDLASFDCDRGEPVSTTFDNGAGWDLCLINTERENLLLQQVQYRDIKGRVFPVFASAGISQLQVVYDDSLITYNDVTQFGLGGESIINLSDEDCPDGTLISSESRRSTCVATQQVEPAHHSHESRAKKEALNLFSVTEVGAYNYVLDWTFFDNGAIQPAVGATGALQRSSANTDSPYGRVLSEDPDVIWLSHTHNYYWRLDFDLGEIANDDVIVESEQSFGGDGQRITQSQTFVTEQARRINPDTQLHWTVYEFAPETPITGVTGVTDPTARGYRIAPERHGHRLTRKDIDPYSDFDFFVTVANDCERFASQNERFYPACEDDVLQFANDESIVNQDTVMWHRIAFHHVPRNEDQRHMHAHWDAFTMFPVNINMSSPSVDTLPSEDEPVADISSEGESSGGFFGAVSFFTLALLTLGFTMMCPLRLFRPRR